MTDSSVDAKFSLTSSSTVVIANMIGTGVFTSLGFQLLEIQSGFVILMLWAVGGVVALCGALSYAELGAALPRSGGEYNFLTRIYHPAAGFISGWVSSTIGFAAPTALVALTSGAYLSSALPFLPDGSATWVAGLLVIKDGVIRYERYGLGNTDQTRWVSFSVTKSVTSMLVGAAIADNIRFGKSKTQYRWFINKSYRCKILRA